VKRLIFSALFLVNSFVYAAKISESKELLHRYVQEGKLSADAVRVLDTSLVYTGQISSHDLTGTLSQQCVSVFDLLNQELTNAGSNLTQIVRLNCYYTNDSVLDVFRVELKKRLLYALPVISYIPIQDKNSKAFVMCEAVAISTQNNSHVVRLSEKASILPKGPKVFVSGQAEKGRDAVTSVHATMAGLIKSLKYLGLTSNDCVQIKAFIKSGLDKAELKSEIVSFFEGVPPPIVMIDWSGDYNAEIEMVAASSQNTQDLDSTFYGYFPWLHKSPRYSSYVRVKADTPLIFIGQIEADSAITSSDQLTRVFEKLGTVLFKSGSSYRNLVKATYYLGDLKLRTGLSDIRGVYFDPMRAPAASAIGIEAFDRAGVTFGIDVVAVPATQ
jgi:enamine deaminase RidA (YjgF/YER057c/UK114 family)